MNLEEKQQRVVSYFIENPYSTMKEIGEAIGFSASSCQRYLTLPRYSNILIEKTNRTISEQLDYNKKQGNRKGGRTTFLRYESIKGKSGKFVGLIKDNNRADAEDKKIQDIINIVTYFSKNPYDTLQQIATFFDNIYTEDYIYDCLKDIRVEEIFGKEIASDIIQQLTNNRYGILKKYKDNLIDELFDFVGLTEQEIQVLKYRFNNGKIQSSSDAANLFGVSKTRIIDIENNALRKIEEYNLKRKEK